MIYVLINTYNRPEMLDNLLSDIFKTDNINVQIYDDGSTVEYPCIEKYPVNYTKFAFNHGKKQYWSLMNFGFREILKTEFDYYFVLQDDLRLCPDFFNKAIGLYESIKDDKKICLNILLDKQREGKSVWTGIKPIRVKHGDNEFYLSQWTDCIFMAQKNFFKTLDCINPVPESRWEIHPNLSSGVGAQISMRIVKNKLNIYQVTETLVYHGDHESQMNPIERRKNKLTT